MKKKLKICSGKTCKKAGTDKIIKKWSKELKLANKVNKVKCLGVCKETFAIKFKGEIYSCQSKEELNKIIDS
jgi:NADH:ubiquinone oxidoreductase subunit E